MTIGAVGRGQVLGAASGVRDARGGVTPARAAPGRGAATRIDSADAPPSEITAAWRSGPITARRRTVSDTTRSADATPSGLAAAGGNDRFTARRLTISDTTRSADAIPARAAVVGRNGPVGVLGRRGWSRWARWG
ncbi:hypothetical protein ABZY05_29050 [Streptomyces canus]|uniref:hypothetical protein n=1 Tax=Streptomyces canus TaxID=58343 RepID=UPI0033A6C255